MKLTRRSSLVTLATIAVAIPQKALPQTPAAAPSDPVSGARARLGAASRELASVKLARNIEPAARFEA